MRIVSGGFLFTRKSGIFGNSVEIQREGVLEAKFAATVVGRLGIEEDRKLSSVCDGSSESGRENPHIAATVRLKHTVHL